MAIDTALKRLSVQNYAAPGVALPIPSGSIGQGERQTVAWIYAGIFNANPSFTGEIDVYFIPERNPLYVNPLGNGLFYDPDGNVVQYATTRNPLYVIPLSNPVYYDPDN